MAISYPLTPPSSPIEREISLVAKAIVAVSVSPFTFSQQAQAHQGQAWALSMSLPPMERADAEAWVAFLLKLNGRQGTFLFGATHWATPRGVATGTPLVNGGSQTGNELVTDGWTTGITGILKTGDMIQLGSGASARLHKVLEDVDSDGGGNATLLIWPSLRTSPADDAAIVVSSAKGLFRLVANQVGWDVTVAQHFGLSIEAEEAL